MNSTLRQLLGIGTYIVDGTPKSVLFIGADGFLSESNPAFIYENGILVLTPAGTTAIKSNKNIVLKSGQKMIYDGA